jgi:hypothetical protein
MNASEMCIFCGADWDTVKGCETCSRKHAAEEDVVHQPNHYARWAIEPITFIMRNGMEFWRGNLIKYSTRAGYKQYDGKDMVESEITDLEKVKRYCDMRINQLNGETQL